MMMLRDVTSGDTLVREHVSLSKVSIFVISLVYIRKKSMQSSSSKVNSSITLCEDDIPGAA